MVLALRIDIDNPFGLSSRFRRRLNRFSINYGLIPRSTRLGYLDNASDLRDWLENQDIPATWFFRTATCPTKSLLPFFTKGKNQINLHAERTSSFEDFTQEVRTWEKLCATKVTGFSKHGSGVLKLSKMHDVRYDPESLLQFAKELGLTYFVGNGMDYLEPFTKDNGFTYVPSVFWLDRIDQYGTSGVLEKLVEDSAKNPVVLLIHPVWWAQQPELKKNFEWLLKKTEFVPFDSIL